MTDDYIDWDAVKRIAEKYGLTLYEVRVGSEALYQYEESQAGISGQTVRPMTPRQVQTVIQILAAARKIRRVEFALMREDSMPDMSGKPRYVQIVAKTFATAEDARVSKQRVPGLRDRPAIVCRRIAPGEWEEVKP